MKKMSFGSVIKERKMTLTQYKKIIKALSREDLENHLFELFKVNKVFKDIESAVWDSSSNEKLVEECEKN